MSPFDPSWSVPESVERCLSPFQRDFCAYELGRPLEVYMRRCRAMGLADMEHVLDAGCGVGQWTLALARLNKRAYGLDVDSARLLMAEFLARKAGASNVEYRYGKLESLPFASNSMDAVLCYSAIMFVELRAGLREMRRVLRPGGKMVVMVDLWPWHWQRLQEGRLGVIHFVKLAVRSMLRYQRDVLYSEQGFLGRLRRAGFEIVSAGSEGTVGFDAGCPPPELRFFPETGPRRRLLEVAARALKSPAEG